MRKLAVFILSLCLVSINSYGQFRDFNNMAGGGLMGNGGGMFGTSQPDGSSSPNDTVSRKPDPNQFTMKKYFSSLAHKDSVGVGWTWAFSMILPGTAQIYNGDYKKLPIFYGGMAAGIGVGAYFNYRHNMYNENSDKIASVAGFATAGAFYLASVLDGVISYKTTRKIHPGKASIYSALLPGAGQAYLGDWWRIPIYYAGLAVAGYCWYYNDLQFNRFRAMYLEAIDPNGNYTGSYSTDNLKFYRDQARRLRNYSIIATFAIYILQIIDANVFATLSDFDINDDLTMNLSPAVITPIQPYNGASYATASPAYGLSLNLSF
ncbi:MAG: hypothetical protein KBS57_05160 [Alistipes sp.]|nr:hypothetical protein [Candidatus Minthomonas equi]